ncbi:putative protamine P1 [Rosellinia necatrix]|uniref:Putative protamine P1 n=1 Tax=Rosellinia necatrix TaxID=77044 RepID=A0A1W2TC20_ROSNE|nr:putative protamine P1 [Rosellinia necatrix]
MGCDRWSTNDALATISSQEIQARSIVSNAPWTPHLCSPKAHGICALPVQSIPPTTVENIVHRPHGISFGSVNLSFSTLLPGHVRSGTRAPKATKERLMGLGGGMNRVMDRGALDRNSWRQVCLDDEPIYCPAPSPSISDIICPGSDDDADEATRNAKILRYEEHGRRYLQGRPLRILSASLHGPFDRASGWQNPWLPKRPSENIRHLKHPSRPSVTSSATRHEIDIPVDGVASEGDSANKNLGSFMECHLPSPRSHENLQFSRSPSHAEKCSQIKSWAEDVHESVPATDRFWAPNRSYVDSHAEPAMKRPAGRDWLKRRSAKKRKPSPSHNASATYTSTPTPAAPIRSRGGKESTVGRIGHRSFEMTTPSSSPGKGPEEPLVSADTEPAASHEEVGSQMPSYTFTEGSKMVTKPPVQVIQGGGQMEQMKGEHHDETGAENAEMLENVRLNPPRSQTSYSDNLDETVRFQDYADESFCYRAREAKQGTPPTKANASIACCSPQRMQTKSPMLHGNDETTSIPSSQNIQESNLNIVNSRHKIIRNGSPTAVTIHEADNCTTTTPESGRRLLQLQEPTLQNHEAIDTSKANSTSKISTSQPLSDMTSSKQASRLNIRNILPHTVPRAKQVQSRSTGAVFDEGLISMSNLIDRDESRDAEPAEQRQGNYSYEDSALLQHYTISTPKIHNTSQLSKYSEAATPNKANDAASYATATISPPGAIESQSRLSKHTNHILPQEMAKSVINADASVSQDGENISENTIASQAVLPEQQSPWVPLYPVNESIQARDDKASLTGEESKELLAQPIVMPANSPKSAYYSTAIHPSQQSPWVQECTELARATTIEGPMSLNTPAIVGIQSPEKDQSPLMLANQERLPFPSPAILPTSSKSPSTPYRHPYIKGPNGATEKQDITLIQNPPYTPISKVARQTTPDGEISIRSFSNFNHSSPPRSTCFPGSSTSRSILSSRKHHGTTKSSKQVSFALLSHEQGGDDNEPYTRPRAASPPPPKLVDQEEENVDGKYRNHFDIMNRRISIHGIPGPQYRQRLLPSSSQQKPESPSIEAMARAFREADIELSGHTDNTIGDTRTDHQGLEVGSVVENKERPQSPWQHDSQGIDDVAVVMGNLPEFLDLWDVNTEMDRN